MIKRQEDRIVEDIKRHFGFLLDKGYQIRDVCYYPESFGNWYVTLETSRFLIRIDYDRSYLSISFDPEKTNDRRQFNLESLIYYLSNGEHFVDYFTGNPAWAYNKQFERMAGLLKEYHEQIADLFEADSRTIAEDLMPYQEKYFELLQASYSRRYSSREKYWKWLNILGLFTRFIGVNLLAYLGWAVGVVFITETDAYTKIQSGVILFAVIIMLVVLIRRLARDLQK